MAGLSWWISYAVYHRAPVTADEQSYLFQAHLFEESKIRRETPAIPEAFLYSMIIMDKEVGWLSRYPPGHPAWLALGIRMSSPFLAIALAAALGMALTAWCARLLGAPALIAMALLFLSPWYVFMYGTILSHTTGFVAVALMVGAYMMWQQKGRGSWAIVAGLAWGWLFMNRTYTAVLMALPLGVHALWYVWTRRDRRAVVGTAMFAGAAAFGVAATLVYNFVAVGDPWTMTYLYYDPSDRLGFGRRHYHPVFPPPLPVEHTLRAGLLAMWDNVRLLDRWLWGVPGSLAIWAGLTVIGWKRRCTGLLVALVLAVWLGYVGFWYSGWNEAGPDYYFETLPVMVLTAAMGLAAAGRRWLILPWQRVLAVSAVLVLWAAVGPSFFAEEAERIQEVTRFRGRVLETIETAPPKTLIFMTEDATREAWEINDMVFNPRGLDGSVIVARHLGAADATVAHYFDGFTPTRLTKVGDQYELRPYEPPVFDGDMPISRLHRRTGTNILDDDRDGAMVRIAQEGDPSNFLIFGRRIRLHPGRYVLEYDIRTRSGTEDEAPIAVLALFAEGLEDVLCSHEVSGTHSWHTLQLDFTMDDYLFVEPSVLYLGNGEIRIARVRIREK